MTYVIGITGGIGSGKTLVSDHFASLGVPVIDTDVIARYVVEPGQSALDDLVRRFGKSILLASGELDRNKLRELAFADTESKAALDAITHPAIRRETFKQITETDSPYCLVVVPLLTADSPFGGLMKRVLVVTADRDVKIDRVQARSGLDEAQVKSIMQTQLSDKQREEFADDIVANDGTVADAHIAVEKLHQAYLKLAKINSID